MAEFPCRRQTGRRKEDTAQGRREGAKRTQRSERREEERERKEREEIKENKEREEGGNRLETSRRSLSFDVFSVAHNTGPAQTS